MRLLIPEMIQKEGGSLSQLARKTGISRMTLWRYSTGRQEPTLTMALQIAEALDVPLQNLIPKQSPFSLAFIKAIRKQQRQAHLQEDKSWVPILMLSTLEDYRNTQHE